MRTSLDKLVLISLLFISSTYAFALDTSEEEKICVEIGFSKKNNEFGDCVLNLVDKKRTLQQKFTNSNSASIDPISYRSSPAQKNSNNLWNLGTIAQTSSSLSYLNRPDGSTYDTIKVSDAKSLVLLTSALGLSAGVQPVLFLRESDEINAAATYDAKGVPMVILNKPMMDLIKDDHDMAAALIGHEIAHLSLGHIRSRAATNMMGSLIGIIAGVALESIVQTTYGLQNIGIEGGNLIGTVFATTFSRDQEREADSTGIKLAQENGYSPDGAVRLFQAIEKKTGNSPMTFLKTHPNPSERIKNAKEAMKN
jgi:Zn-dependent protease with chaperone function